MKGIVILGPTGVGKTELSLDLAEQINSSIISADSMQIYKYLDIGTAKVTEKERNRVFHYMIDVIEPNRKYNVGEYANKVNSILKTEFENKSKIPLIVGGTGLYIDAITKGIAELPESNTKVRNELEKFDINMLLKILKEFDPESYNEIDKKNKVRIVRAIEVCRISGEKFSDLKKNNIKNNNFKFLKFGLYRDREKLYKRINQRVDMMFEKGLLSEAEKVYNIYKDSLKKVKAIGYNELIGYFENRYSLEEAKKLIKRNSRRYAKRQLTWFKKDNDIKWFDLEKNTNKEIIKEITKEVKI